MVAKERTREEKKKLVRLILKECTKAVKSGVGSKSVGEKARKHWLKGGTKNIKKQVDDPKMVWSDARKRVLPTAKKMGRVAAVLAGARKVIPQWAAEAAAVAVKNDPHCPGGGGQGGFCP